MKRSVTGGETKAAAHKGKAIVLRWLGARQRLYLERRIRRDSASITTLDLYMELILLLYFEEYKLIYPKLV